MSSVLKHIYRSLRSVVFATLLIIFSLYLLIYILVAVPAVQDQIRVVAERELSAFLDGEVRIGRLYILPFSEVRLSEVRIAPRNEAPCLEVLELGAGIDLWSLVSRKRIDITYGDIRGLKGDVVQEKKDGPLNIDFIIKALSPKDRNKPPTRIDLTLRDVTIRNSSLSFTRRWMDSPEDGRIDFGRLSLTGLNADILLSRLTNDKIRGEVRHLRFLLQPGLQVEDIKCKLLFTQTELTLSDFELRTRESFLTLSDIDLTFTERKELVNSIKNQSHRLTLSGEVTPSEFKIFEPRLGELTEPWSIELTAEGNAGRLDISQLEIASPQLSSSVSLRGVVEELEHPGYLSGKIDDLKVKASPLLMGRVLDIIGSGKKSSGNLTKVKGILRNLGGVDLRINGSGNVEEKKFSARGNLTTGCGGFTFDFSKGESYSGTLRGESFDVGRLLSNKDFGSLSLTTQFDIRPVGKGKLPVGIMELDIPYLQYRGYEITGLTADAEFKENEGQIELGLMDESAEFDLGLQFEREGKEWYADFGLDVGRFVPSSFNLLMKYEGYSLSTELEGSLSGSSPETLLGELRLVDTHFENAEGDGLQCALLELTADAPEPHKREVKLSSDWVDGHLTITDFNEEKPEGLEKTVDYKGLANAVMELLNETFPILELPVDKGYRSSLAADFGLKLKASPGDYEFFKLPVFPLGEGEVTAFFDSRDGEGEVNINFPYLQQGKKTLIQRTHIEAVLNRESGTCGLNAATFYPAKKGDMDMELQLLARNGNIFSDIIINRETPGAVMSGDIALNTALSRNALTNALEAKVDFVPSRFFLKGQPWQLDRGSVVWSDGSAKVDHFNLHRDNQYLSIDGVASKSEEDELDVRLAGIDIGAIFDILNINYVTFGGVATGEVYGRGLLSPSPILRAEALNVAGLSYNGAVLGDGILRSHFDTDQKKFFIGADITEDKKRCATIEGGIWLGRDSLSFDIDADKVDIGFMAPFVGAFSTDLKGRASGKAKLYGTFSDIDLVGRLKADTISLRLLSTNVVYSGSDSVFMSPGRIEIPNFRIYDRSGNSAMLSGELRHRYFHDPTFDFQLLGARDLLCYDIPSTSNPDWYGTIYGSGNGRLTGRPGVVSVDVDMTSSRGSVFTFVLSDKESVADYRFLTFTDKRKEAEEKSRPDTIPHYLKKFFRQQETAVASETDVELDFRATVTPDAQIILVMDPEGGDKIVARGGGALQMLYSSASNDLKMYGKYVLDEGSYNFTLQDIILKDFTIRSGSAIAFNGNPLDADLDISATYRVNTSLTDLDQSFASDRELNRTNVPVDAVMIVRGDMTHPDITFDISLPTLTSDVERKVKSLISTDDLMSRQIIYLLALNRFYTPEYNSTTNASGSEFSSMASSTISSQLSNILSRMSDNLSVAPSFRSDKGDFSDMEVDVALSSRLLDNRLLINGNFGYRDRAATNQSTQFVGDFDIEYLLNKSGNLRLKAYNRFNDQSYYLRQALTTQGVGLVVRRDFNHIFSFLRPFRKKKESQEKKEEKKEEKVSNEAKREDVDSILTRQ